MMKLLLALLLPVLSVVTAAFGQVSAEATSVPAPRYGHQMMTYDEGNQCVLLFGGSGRSNSYGDLWAFDRRGWRQLSNTGPAPRDAGVLVYDARRKRTVLYGGRDRTGALRDTWEWDGTRWHAVAQQGPAPGIHAAAAYDRQRGVVVLFVPLLTVGQSSQPLQAETWTWGGKQWIRADASAPAGHMPMGMTFDAARGTVVQLVGKFDFSASAAGNGTTELWEWTGEHWRRHPVLPPAIKEPFQSNIVFAGGRGGLLLFDGDAQATWRWDQKKWTQVSKVGPTKRNVHVMAYDSARRRVVLFGGSKQRERLGDTWEWDGTTWRQIAADGPRHYGGLPGFAYDGARRRIMLFGKSSDQEDVAGHWHWDGKQWTQAVSGQSASANQPLTLTARNRPALAYDATRKEVLLFGGAAKTKSAPDVWEWQPDTWAWNGQHWRRLSETGPAARALTATAFDSRRQKLVLFGGEHHGAALGDTWEWDGQQWRQVATDGPSARYGHLLAYDSRRGKVVLFGGGGNGKPYFDDTWEWDGKRWSKINVSGPAGRTRFGLAYDAQRAKVVLFGGTPQQGVDGTTWEYDGRRWQQVSATGPSARSRFGMTYDSARARTVLFGGYDGKAFQGDTWEWDGKQWMQVSSGAALGPRSEAPIVYDAQRRKVVLYGGGSAKGILNDVWEWGGRQWSEIRNEHPQ